MTRPDGRTDMSRPGTRTTAAVTLLVLLLALAGIAGGIGGALIALGATGLGAGGYVLVHGGTSWLRIVSRRTAAGVAVAGFLVLGAGTAFAPTPTRTVAAEGAAPSSTAAPTPPSAPPAASAPTASLAMSCPSGSGASPLFGQRITAMAPYRVTIEYGDGDRYTNDDQHLSAVFSHTYSAPGSYLVTAVLTDVTGRTATASCTYRWAGRTR
jgi:hypothetical protein